MDLRKFILEREKEARNLPCERLSEIFAQLSIGLKGIHERGIIHGDIKPDNVLVFFEPTHMSSDQDGYVYKISDFGRSQIYTFKKDDKENELDDNLLWGTFAYLAPE